MQDMSLKTKKDKVLKAKRKQEQGNRWSKIKLQTDKATQWAEKLEREKNQDGNEIQT